MTTQKDIHNILVKADDTYKMNLIKQCDYDIEKIKEFEIAIANIANVSAKTLGQALDYMNEEIK